MNVADPLVAVDAQPAQRVGQLGGLDADVPYDVRRAPSAVQVTTSWSACIVVPTVSRREMSRGVSCMVLFMARACHANDDDARQPAQSGNGHAARVA